MSSFIQYSGRFDEIYTERVTINYERNGISNIELSFHDRQVTFVFNLTEATEDINYAKRQVKQALEDVINLLLYHYGYFISDVKLDRFNNQVFLSSSLIASSYLSIKPDFEDIKTGIINNTLLNAIRGNTRFRLFRSALNVTDPFGKYMFLYSILYDIKGNQVNVEEYIKQQNPNVEICSRINTRTGNTIQETVFSWIRNQVGHSHETTDVKCVSEKINQYTKALEQLVKKAIFNV